ncbi:MAG: 5'-methylthioadenosine/adenosylhomocysteine nucleosidase [Odoribacteraceae bacterium]|jgi:adenosylhomocysteine nucleosidase|nr:5'-methylthioadenosine/adenosylhomocysteine nucleosidase [Odoribacteraceae bacterium]
MKRVGVIVAMRQEYDLARAVLECRREHLVRGMSLMEGNIDGAELVLLQCGIGKVNSAIGAVEMIREHAPDIIINTGVAGGIHPDARVMDVIVGDEVAYHDVWCGDGNAWGQIQGLPPRFTSPRRLYHLALATPVPSGRLRGGLICSGDRFITTNEEKDHIRARFPEALAVDMESASIAQTCHLYGIPFLAYRLISDTPGIEEHARQFRDFWNEAPARSFEMLRAIIRGAINN